MEAPDDVPRPNPLITAACKLEGKINRRNDLELPARGKDEAVEATERGAGAGVGVKGEREGERRGSAPQGHTKGMKGSPGQLE